MHSIITINRQMYNFKNRLITITARGVRGRGGGVGNWAKRKV